MGSKTVKWCHILTLMQSNLLNPSGFNLGLKLTFKYQASAESLLEKLVLGVIIHVNILIENAKLKKTPSSDLFNLKTFKLLELLDRWRTNANTFHSGCTSKYSNSQYILIDISEKQTKTLLTRLTYLVNSQKWLLCVVLKLPKLNTFFFILTIHCYSQEK